MRYRWLPFALLLISSIPSAAQQLDSLNYIYNKALDERDVAKQGISLSNIARYYYYLPKYDSSIHYYSLALEINQRVGNDTMVAANLNDFGNLYKDIGNLDSAIAYYQRAVKIFNKAKDNVGAAYVQTNLSRIYKDRGLYQEALEMALMAEKILEAYPDDINIAACYNNIGSIYNKMDEYDDALVYYTKALEVWKKNNDKASEASALNNIGNVYLNIAKYDVALSWFQRSLEIKRTLSNKRSLAVTLNNMGETFMKLRRFVESEKYYEESLTIKQQLNDRLGQATTLNNLASCKIQLKEYNLAKQFLDEAENLEKAVGGVLNEKKKNLEVRIALNRAIKNYAKASDYAEELLVVKDSLLSIEKAEAMAEIQTRYETERKEQQIEILSAEHALNQTEMEVKNLWITVLIIAIALIIVIAVLVYNSFRLARKARQRGETLMKELHHRVKNNLQVISSVLSLQSRHLTDENALLSVKSTEGRINAMALIHRKLYSDETNTIVSTRGYFRELIEYLMSSYGFDDSKLKLKVDIDEIELDVDKAIPLGLIVNELISNAFKHAYTKQANAELDIHLKQRSQQLEITVKDNGTGLPARGNTDEEKFGSRMVAILVKDLRGTYFVDSANGTTHSLTIPLV